MFQELILALSPEFFLWNKVRLSEPINYCSLSQLHKQKSRKEPKKLGDFQNVSDSEVHDFPFVSSVHSSLMYLVFCVSRAISGVCFSRGWPSNGHNYAHCAFFVWWLTACYTAILSRKEMLVEKEPYPSEFGNIWICSISLLKQGLQVAGR